MNKYKTPDVLTAAKQNNTPGKNRDGSAVYNENSIIAAELARIADELHTLNQNLSIVRRDGTEAIGLARILIENGTSRASR